MLRTIGDLIILKDGTSINGEVLTSKFVLKLKFGTLRLTKSDILSIEYKNPPFIDVDEVRVSAGTRLHGDLLPEVIQVRIEDTSQIFSIPKSDIHSIVLFTGRSRRLSSATRRTLKAVTQS
jgi:hypothetical protein